MNRHSPTPILKIKTLDQRIEVYLLNVGDHFPNFGGSRHAKIIEETASLIIRTDNGPSGVLTDDEYDIDDRHAWRYIATMIARYGTVDQLRNSP